MVFDQLQVSVLQQQADIDFREAGEEVGDDRQHMQLAELDRRGDNQPAFRFGELACSLPFGFLHLLDDPPGGRKIAAAGIRQVGSAGAADEKLRSERRFEIRDFARKRGDRDVERSCGRRKVAGVGNPDQHRHRFYAVHRLPVRRPLPDAHAAGRRTSGSVESFNCNVNHLEK
jgi:hypothetical protein